MSTSKPTAGYVRNSKGQVFLIDPSGKAYSVDPKSCPAASNAILLPDTFIDSIHPYAQSLSNDQHKMYCMKPNGYKKWIVFGVMLTIVGIGAKMMMKSNPLQTTVTSPLITPTLSVPTAPLLPTPTGIVTPTL